MSGSRIWAVLLQQIFITRRQVEVWFDVPVFAAINILVFGLISRFVSAEKGPATGRYVILGMMLWEVIRIGQYLVTVNSLWSLWSHNLSNIFITPLSLFEYVFAYCLSSLLITSAIFSALSITVALVFGFNILNIGLGLLVLAFVNLLVFSWVMALPLLGLVFRFGVRVQAIAWGAIFLFQPLTAAFFPLSILPRPLQAFARALPPTYVFEAARTAVREETVLWNHMAIASGLNIVYLTIGGWLFFRLFQQSRVTGQFARNDI